MKNNRIMIIDDDRSIRECMGSALECEDFDVSFAENGKLALDKLNATESCDLPACIIVDLMMPVMGGYEFLNCISPENSAHLSKIPVIVATAGAKGPRDRTLMRASRLLAKPFELNELYDAVHVTLNTPIRK